MFRKECWTKYKNGLYGYKNGTTVKHENNKWIVYTVYNDKRNILFVGLTLKECKSFIANDSSYK